MNSTGTSSLVALILHFNVYIVLWSFGFAAASKQCPDGQYLDRSSSCVSCTTCLHPYNIVVTPCYGRNDTVCRSIIDLKSSRIKEEQLPSKDKNQKEPIGTENSNVFFETIDSYNNMLGGLKNKVKKNKDAAIVYEDGQTKLEYSFVGSNNLVQLSPPKSFDKNGKHIKKDLSSVDENQTSKPYDVSRNPWPKKKLSKSKKTNDEPPIDDKLSPTMRLDLANARVSAEVEPKKIIPLFSSKKATGIPNGGSRKMKNKTKLLDSAEDESDISQNDEYISEDEDAEDIDYGDDENEDDDDEEDNAGEVDDDFDPPFTIDKGETSEKPFGIEDTILTDLHDDDYTEIAITRNKYEVNVEPYIDTTNWQLLILVSAASACFLFFVVVNTYLCIYMKRWRHMKQDFEAGVEDLSVRINLMQHAGFEADESNNIRNYITQLRGEKTGTEKSKSTI